MEVVRKRIFFLSVGMDWLMDNTGFVFVCFFVARIEDKIKVFQATMRGMRLEEEKRILVKEMAQHCSFLQKLKASLQSKISAEGKFKSWDL